jgi:hypothetical protein
LNPSASFLFRHFVSQNPLLFAAQALSADAVIPLEQAKVDAETAFDTFAHFFSLPSPEPVSPDPQPDEPFFFSETYLINGTRFHLSLSSLDLAEEISSRLAALRVPDAPPDHFFAVCEEPDGVSLYRNGFRFAKEPLITGARALLLQELTLLSAPDRDFKAILHAGACGTPAAAIILAGPSFSGKSTLCAALTDAGYLCFSDDSACLTPDFQVAGMPFALALRENPRFRPSNLAGLSSTVPPVALIFVNYQPDAPECALEPVSAFDSFLELQKSGFWVEHTESAIASFLHWLSAIPRYKLTYSSLPHALVTLTKQFFV